MNVEMIDLQRSLQDVTTELSLTAPLLGVAVAYYVAARFLLHRWWMRGAAPAQLERARAWLITLALSSFLSVAGLYYTIHCVQTWASEWPLGNFEMDFNVDHESTWSPLLDSRFCSRVMLAFCTLDLAAGVVDYRQHLGVVTAWLHHSVYMCLLVYLLCTRMSFTLMVFTNCEWPTLLLAVGNLHPPLRTDLGFGVVFFVTRIVFTGILFVLLQLFNRFLFQRACAALLFPLHVMWFRDWYRGYVRRSSKAAAALAAETKRE